MKDDQQEEPEEQEPEEQEPEEQEPEEQEPEEQKENKPTKQSTRATKPKRDGSVRKPAQRGRQPRTELPTGEMSKNERKLLGILYSSSGPRESKALHELQKICWPKIKGTSEARNTIRRLVKFGWLELQEPTKQEIAAHDEAGKGRLYSKYRLTEKGRKRGID